MINDFCVFELRNETLRETFLAITGSRPEADWPRVEPEYFPGWTERDTVRRCVIERDLDWGSAEAVLGGIHQARSAAGWKVRAPGFALDQSPT